MILPRWINDNGDLAVVDVVTERRFWLMCAEDFCLGLLHTWKIGLLFLIKASFQMLVISPQDSRRLTVQGFLQEPRWRGSIDCSHIKTPWQQPSYDTKGNSQEISVPQTWQKQSKRRPTSVQLNDIGRQRQADFGSRDRPTEWHHCRESGTKREEVWRAGMPGGHHGRPRQQYGHPAHSSLCENGSMFCGRTVQTFCISRIASGASSSRKEAPWLCRESVQITPDPPCFRLIKMQSPRLNLKRTQLTSALFQSNLYLIRIDCSV